MKNILPQKLKQIWTRSQLKMNPSQFKNVVFKIAETQDELEQAYKLLYTVFRAKHLITTNTSEMKITKLDALPTTKMLIAIEQSRVRACLSLSFEGAFRTPTEEHFDLNFIKKQNKHFIEISHFAIDPEISRFKDDFFLPLCRLCLEFNASGPSAEYLVTSLPPSQFDYFKAVFGLQRLKEQSNLFDDFNLRPAICAFSVLSELQQKMMKMYGEAPSKRNIYHYLFEAEDQRLKLQVKNELYSPEQLSYFFNTKTDILATLTSFEKRNLHQIYLDSKYRDLFPRPSQRTSKDRSRSARRYEVDVQAELLVAGKSISTVTLKTISQEGIGLISSEKLILDSTYTLFLNQNGAAQIELLVTPVWASRDQTYGLVVRKYSANWLHFVEKSGPNVQQAS